MAGPDMITMGRLPQTPRAKKVIEFAIEEARVFDHNYVGTEHLLLGLLREDQGVAAQVLMNLGLRLEMVREEVLNILGNAAVSAGPGVPRELIGLKADESEAAAEKCVPPEMQHLPESAREIVAAFDCQIDVIKEEKEAAVRTQMFDKAAELRDLEYKLRKL